MKRSIFAGALAVAAFTAPPGHAGEEDILQELAPTGTLRVAIGVGPVPGAFYTVEDTASGGYRGVTIELATALGEKLGVPVTFVPYLASGEIQGSANDGTWDVTFMPVDEARKQVVDFGNAYHILQSTYLVAADSPLGTIEDANAAGVRIAGIGGTATLRASNRASPDATHIAVARPEDAVAMVLNGEADAIAMGRESLGGLLPSVPGGRILDGGFLNSTTAIAVPKGNPAALAYISAFIEEAKSSGLVRRAFDAMGMQNSIVAPPGMKP